MKTLVLQAHKRVGISELTVFKAKHVSKLTSTMMSAIAFICCNVTLSGNVKEKRNKLKELLGGADEEETEEPDDTESVESDENESDEDEDVISYDRLNVGDLVEVYWHGEKKWFEGEVISCDMDSEESIEIHYKDGAKLWHSEKDYKMRLQT